MNRNPLPLFAILLTLATACGDSGGFTGKKIPAIEVNEGIRPVAPDSVVSVPRDLPVTLTIVNTGSAPLDIDAFTLTSTPPGAFTLVSLPDPSADSPITLTNSNDNHVFSITYNPIDVQPNAEVVGEVTIHTNTTLNSGTSFTFRLARATATPLLIASPSVLDFAVVAQDTSVTRTVNLLNMGRAPVTIDRITFGGAAQFTALINAETFTATGATASGAPLAAPLVIPGGHAAPVEVTYTARSPEAAQASLIFFSDDEAAPNGTEVKLYANLAGPCVLVRPDRVDFGAKLIGRASTIEVELESCGDLPLIISALELSNDAGGVFTLGPTAPATFPLTLPAGERIRVPVVYTPTQLPTVLPNGDVNRDVGTLHIASNAYLNALDVTLSGSGSDGSCPEARITVREGGEVIPQTELHLSGSGSTSTQGNITGYTWSVIQPTGSVSAFVPNHTAAEVTFEPNIVGTYIFRLKVVDAAGTESCTSAEYTVIVSSDDALHVELLWRTPGDPNESDVGGDGSWSAGSDLDLHFLHPKAFGTYFDPVYDCYWFTPYLNWGGPTDADNPRLDRDDTDGGGPENLNMRTPEANSRYQVGVHFWNDWGYGPAFATVRVYIYDQLRDQWPDVRLIQDDMWSTHTIDWPSTTIRRMTAPSGSPLITPNFPVN